MIDRERRRLLTGTAGGLILLGAALGLPGAARGGTAGPPLGGSLQDFSLIDPPRPVPRASFLDANQQPATMDQFKGRVVLLNFWATWCAPCREEMPSIDRLQAQLGGPDFTVLALSLDEGGITPVRHFYQQLGIQHLDIYLDPPNALPLALKVPALPTTLVIDRAGQIVGTMVGPAVWDSPEALALLRYFIEKDKPAGTGTGSTTSAT
ncbi:MAG TPA: TlpA disulfide reductase family protein [Hypericibacter adhaerens]|jgi:thiol-disulfide isomerase/thioredoxin|nr:TlpA disulfide reductase family protein [Hypericibacter adhaerens]HWA46046.1 TlpA disulfide reductase family protein [Hypericibacter adhaerens]